jgi:hypothetical protein
MNYVIEKIYYEADNQVESHVAYNNGPLYALSFCNEHKQAYLYEVFLHQQQTSQVCQYWYELQMSMNQKQ